MLAQFDAGAVRPEGKFHSVHINKSVNAQIRVDGNLGEPVWQTVTPITDLVQTQPDLGKPVS